MLTMTLANPDRLLPYFCQTIAGSMHFSSYMIRIYKFADMLPANFYIPD